MEYNENLKIMHKRVQIQAAPISLAHLRASLRQLFKEKNPPLPKSWFLKTEEEDFRRLADILHDVGNEPEKFLWFRAKQMCSDSLCYEYGKAGKRIRSIKGLSSPFFVWLFVMVAQTEAAKPILFAYGDKLKERRKKLKPFHQAVELLKRAAADAPDFREQVGQNSISLAAMYRIPAELRGEADLSVGYVLKNQFPGVVEQLQECLHEVEDVVSFHESSLPGLRVTSLDVYPIFIRRALTAMYDVLQSEPCCFTQMAAATFLISIFDDAGVSLGTKPNDAIEDRARSLKNAILHWRAPRRKPQRRKKLTK